MTKKHYAICRCTRLKTWNDVAKAVRHNDRDQRERSTIEGRPAPREFVDRGGLSAVAYGKKMLAQCGIKAAEGQVVAVEYMITASPEWFHGKDPKEYSDWINSSLKFINDRHPRGVLSAKLHLDESTPHLHVICMPLYEDIVRKRGARPKTPEAVARRAMEEALAPKVWRLSYDRVMGNSRYALRDMQDQYHRHVQHLGLARGEDTVGQNKRHIPLKELRRQLEERERELDHIGFEQEQRTLALQRAEDELAFRTREFARQVGEIEDERRSLLAYRTDLETERKLLLADLQRRQEAVAIAEMKQREELAAIDRSRADLLRRDAAAEAKANEVERDRAQLDQREADLVRRTSAIRRAEVETAAQLQLLLRHAADRETPRRTTEQLASTEVERNVARQPWPVAINGLRDLLQRTALARRRMAERLLRMRKRLRSLVQRERTVEISERALATRETALGRRERELDGLLTGAETQRRQAAMLDASAREQIRDIASRRKDLEKKEAGLQAERAALLADRAALDGRAAEISVIQGAIDEARRKLTADREGLESRANELARDRAAFEKQSSEALKSLDELNWKNQLIDTENNRLSTMRKIYKAENAIINDAINDKLRLGKKNGKIFVRGSDGCTPLMIEGRAPSNQTSKILNIIINLRHAERNLIDSAQKLRSASDEIEALRPDMKKIIDVQRNMISAATNISFNSSELT
ncbi:plasmid recombination protein [Erythrobacter oryzae]|uniref:plasmid recombination protein n=1 Tax=Erythrobacter oryzae TaxID=3019556 RepID=UPI0025548482|nr:plasmid recombination protein [Erythrobacter sp. COR-2]